MASAQDWATREACFRPPEPVTAEDVQPHSLADLEAAAAQIENANGRFWQVESPTGQVSHLWGTMHVSVPAVLDLPEAVTTAIDKARIVALEIDFTFPDRPAMFSGYEAPGRYQDASDPFALPETLDLSFLGTEPEAWVIDRLDQAGAGEDALFIFTYAGLAEYLLSDPCEDFTAGVIPYQDHFIQTLAHIAGAEIRGLEAPGDLVADLAKDEETAKAMVGVYASYLQPPKTAEWSNAYVQLYLEGRLGMLDAWDAAHLSEVFGPIGLEWKQATDDYLLDERNARFIERIVPELEAGGVFLAVGAAHIPGSKGLVALLRDRGYMVTRVPVPGEME